MAEKRQIRFERYTDLSLGGNWASEWPAYVLVHHEGAVDDVRYVPERTCHDTGARRVFFVCSECGEAYRKDSMRLWHHKPWSFCPNCGARVVAS